MPPLWSEDIAKGTLIENKIRFHIVDSENRRRSAFWFLAGSNNSVYTSVSSIAGQIKLSFHPKGSSEDGNDSQFGSTRRYHTKLLESGSSGSTPFFRWQRPQARENQLSQIASILFPTPFLHGEFADTVERKRRIALEMAPAGHAVEGSIFGSKQIEFCEELLLKTGFKPIVYFDLNGSEYFSIAARNIPFSQTFESQFGRTNGNVQWLDGAPKPNQLIDNNSAIMLLDKPADGRPAIFAEANGITVQRGACD